MSSQSFLSNASENDGASHHIAIVGMAGRFPECESVSELWELLKQQKATHKEVRMTGLNLFLWINGS